jgi:two-component system chemotaxis sensor kinase CheA
MIKKNDEILQAFIDESLGHLSDIEQDLLSIEKAGSEIDENLVNKVFRAAHSIKGDAGFIGFHQVKELSHKIENVLGLIRSQKLIPNPEIINFLLLAFDALKKLILNIEKSDEIDISQYVEALNSITAETPETHKKESVPELKQKGPEIQVAPVAFKLTISEEDLLQIKNEGKSIYLLRADLLHDERFKGKSLQDIVEEIKPYGTVLASVIDDQSPTPAKEKGAGGQSCLHIAFASILAPDEVAILQEGNKENLFFIDENLIPVPLAEGDENKSEKMKGLPVPKKSETGSNQPEVERSESHGQCSPGFEEKEAVGDQKEALQSRMERMVAKESSPASIRVNINLLDSLLNLAGELVLSRNQLLQAIRNQHQRNSELVGQRLNLIISELQETIMGTRMQPIGNLFNKFPRVVHDLAKDLGKEIEFVMEGQDVELDRSLLEAISQPLTHLIRNAVDHGIEPADVRKKLGKGEAGKIVLKALHEAGQVIIEVSDDGKGLEPDKLASAAVSKGFATEKQIKTMSEKEKINLIFLPGFSMAEQVSELSGRGVGMDVVKTNLNKLGGQIDIDSRPAMGTTIRIRLPLTLAIIPTQIVSVGDERFAIPQVNLDELLRIPAGQVKECIELVGNAEVVRLRGQLLPVVRLSAILGLDRTYIDPERKERKPDRRINIADRRSRRSKMYEDNGPGEATKITMDYDPVPRTISDRRYHASGTLNIAVVSTGLIRYALIVDAFHDSEEIVVKPLGRHLKECWAYTGATIMGDGRVILILDVGSLARMVKLSSAEGTFRASEVAKAAVEVTAAGENKLNLLTFRCSKDEHCAIPLNHVRGIKKIRPSDIQSLGGKRVVQYRGGNLPLFTLDEVAGVKPLDTSEQFLAIVFTIAGRELGLLVAGSVESVVICAEVDGTTLKQPGIMGSVIMDGKAILLVDVFELTRILQPDWFLEHKNGHVSVKRGHTVLVVEDSTFFRNQIKELLENDGYQVVDAQDGETAWRLLQEHKGEISLIVTDLEMPHLNGFELTERIRKDKRFSGLPVIALTTLADDEDMERGGQVGVNDYHIKLDKERLLESMEHLIRERRE